MTTPERPHFTVSAGGRHSNVTVFVTHDPEADLYEIEESIKQAARKAVRRARE